MSATRQPNCAKCLHFFVSWLADFPRGCKAYGFRSSEYPCQVVQRESGLACQLFEERKSATSDEPDLREGRLVH